MKHELSPAKSSRLAASLLTVLMCVGCVSVSPVPTTSLQPSNTPPASVRPTSSQAPEPTRTSGNPQTAPPSSAPPASSVPATPTPTVDPQLAARIDAVVAQVPEIRQLEPLAAVPYEIISREQFRQDLIDLNDEEVPPELRAAEERLLKRLGFLPDDADLEALLLELYGGQVAAFYRPDTKRFYIIANDQAFGPADEIIVAHEYTHALQDQHFDLEGTRIKDPTAGDAALGQLAVIEGDATLTMQSWATANLTLQELIEAFTSSLSQLDDPTLASMPPFLRRQLEFPYAEGFTFAQHLHDLGGYDAINAALHDAIPASTEQILHPDKYLANEAPVELSNPDRSAVLGEGWAMPYQQTIGELMLQVWAAGDEAPTETIPGFPVTWPHAEVAEGWGGDRLNMYERPNGAWIIDWLTAWDAQGDAAEFEARMIELQSTLDGPSQVFNSASGVRVIAASDESLINLVL